MIVHLDGKLIGRDQARISVFDRGFLFGDGLYEGLRAVDGVIVGIDHHIERLRQGLAECRIRGFDPTRLGPLSRELLDANGLRDAFVYWQITRGTPGPMSAVRSRLPSIDQSPTVFGYASPLGGLDSLQEPTSCSACVVEDTRWTRGRVKSISLLGNLLGVIEAAERRGDDAIFVRSGFVSEGSTTNVILAIGGTLVTPSLESAPMLDGVTRRLLLEQHPEIVERPVRGEELDRAGEIMLVGTLSMVRSVTALDGRSVGDGRVGEGARYLLASLVEGMERDVHSRHA